MRIAVHAPLDEMSQYSVLCHELAHIYLGHLGADRDHWWPSRTELDRRAIEIEAETTAFLVTARRGLTGSSAAYVSRYLDGGPLPPSVSLDQVAKVASRIQQMADRMLQARESRDDSRTESGSKAQQRISGDRGGMCWRRWAKPQVKKGSKLATMLSTKSAI